MIAEKSMETILETIAEKIKELKTELYFKDLRIKELEQELAKKGAKDETVGE